MGSLFQTWDAVDEKDFEVAIDVILNGADMVIEEEDLHVKRSEWRSQQTRPLEEIDSLVF